MTWNEFVAGWAGTYGGYDLRYASTPRRRLLAAAYRVSVLLGSFGVRPASMMVLSVFSAAAVLSWLEAHPTVHFHFTPTGASWLNMVEAWFSILTRRSVRRGSFDTVRALTRHIRSYIEHWNDNPTPFIWTKEPASIIKKALRRPC